MEGSGAGGGGGAGAGAGDAFASATAPLTWHDFLERMRHPSAADFVKSIKSFIVTFSNTAPDPDADSRAVQEFLSSMETAFRAHPLWDGSSEEELDSAGEGLEKYVLTKLYNRTFATIPEDTRSDEELFEKMGLLQHFIRPENLDIKPEYQNETSWLLAQKELQKINLYKAPRDKLVCILNCCKVITNLLINASVTSNDNPPGADEFLPVLIYITIKANPPQLHSNLQYIQRFRRQTRLVSESAYFFTNILSAESFIWNIDGHALSMDESDFQRKMDSARDFLLGLDSSSSSSNNNNNNSNNNNNNNNNTSTENETSPITETSRGYNGDLEKDEMVGTMEKDQMTGTMKMKQPTVLDLENKGSTELLKEDNLIKYFEEHPYLYARASDLTVSDVEDLLGCYKKLVLQYVSLSKGMGVTPEIQQIYKPEPLKESDPKNTENEKTQEISKPEPVKESDPKNAENEKIQLDRPTETVLNPEPVKEVEPSKELVDHADKELEPVKELVDHVDKELEPVKELVDHEENELEPAKEIVDHEVKSSSGGVMDGRDPESTTSGLVDERKADA